MRPLHIGHFLSHYPRPGGTTTAVRGLSKALAGLGYRSTIYSCSGLHCTEDHKGESYSTIPSTNGITNPFRVSAELHTRLTRNADDLDLLIIHGMFNPKNVPIAEAARCAGIPYVVCPHGLYHPELLNRCRFRKYIYGMLFERPILQAAAAIQVFSDYQTRFPYYRVHAPVIVVPNGFDPTEVPTFACESTPLEHPYLSEGNPRLLYLGRIDIHAKGLDLLLTALCLGIREGALPCTLQLTFIGPDKGDSATLTEMARRLSIAENVSFHGPVIGRNKWSVISSCDALVLTSRYDAFPTVVLEAMIAGKPVILSEHTGMSASVKEAGCGFLVQATSESICSALIQALQSREHWCAIGKRGRDFAYRHLTWTTVVEKAGQCYESLLAGGLSWRGPETGAGRRKGRRFSDDQLNSPPQTRPN